MTTLEQAARQALEALEKCNSALSEELAAWDIDPPLHHVLEASNACDPAIATLREALSGVQALSAAPNGWESVIDEARSGLQDSEPSAFDNSGYRAFAETVIDAVEEGLNALAASPTPPAEQQAAPKAEPWVGNSGFDHQTAADFLSGKTISDEAVRKFVQASRWAHDEKAALNAMLLSVRGVLASREAEIALLKRALMEAEAAPQQEAQEPVALLVRKNSWRAGQWEAAPPDSPHYGLTWANQRQYVYAAPQPAPAPLSFDACDMATAAAQGFRSGQAAAKQEE